jgi:hypothetical protein
MKHTKYIVIGALMATLAAIFQSLPIVLSEAFVILTILSAIPIYIASRLNPSSGVMSYLVAVIVISFLSTHEALFFMCSNGIVGVCLGICSHYHCKRWMALLLSSAVLTLTLSIMNYGIGIPVFGTRIPGMLLIQVLIIFAFSLIYNAIYQLFAGFLFKRLQFAGIKDNHEEQIFNNIKLHGKIK